MKIKRDKRQEVFESINDCFSKLNIKQSEYYERGKLKEMKKEEDFFKS